MLSNDAGIRGSKAHEKISTRLPSAVTFHLIAPLVSPPQNAMLIFTAEDLRTIHSNDMVYVGYHGRHCAHDLVTRVWRPSK
jgi:hypothetical protein